MIQGPLSTIDALMVALSGFVIVFLMLAALWGIILVVSRAVGGLAAKPVPAPAAQAAPVPAAPVPAAPPVRWVELVGIDDTQAACVMAIVSHETGIPLDQLVFKSIKAK